MAREKLATVAIIVCMVAAISTLPAMLIVGGLQPPTVINYYYETNPTNNTTTTNTNTTIYINGTYPLTTPHFMNLTATLPYQNTGVTGPYSIVYSIPLVNRTLVTSMVSFSFNRRPPGAPGSSYYLYSRLNNQTVLFSPGPGEFPYLEGGTVTNVPYYSIWYNYYQGSVYPNASTYALDICGYSMDSTWPNLNVSVSIWWETW
jgi:hypothetical protein